MAKFTLKQIERLNQENKGIKNRFYEDTDGYIYRGLSNGRLFKYAKCSEVSIDDATLKALGSNVCEVLVDINNRVEVIEADYVKEAELSAGLKEAKCFSIAMAAAL